MDGGQIGLFEYPAATWEELQTFFSCLKKLIPKCSMGLEYLPTFGIIWVRCMFLNVGKYSSPMEHLGMLVFFFKGAG